MVVSRNDNVFAAFVEAVTTSSVRAWPVFFTPGDDMKDGELREICRGAGLFQ